MKTRLRFSFGLVAALVALVACGGKTDRTNEGDCGGSSPANPGCPGDAPDAGDVPDEGAEPDAGGAPDAARCVDVDPTSFDRSCSAPSDCVLVPTGEVCDGECRCGSTPISAASLARYAQATAGITFLGCACVAGALPVCLDGQCTLPLVLPPPP